MTYIMVKLLYHIAKCLTLIYMAQPGANANVATQVSNDFCKLTEEITVCWKGSETQDENPSS